MNEADDVPRPILLPLNLASFALLGAFVTCSDALASGQSTGGVLLLRAFFGGGTLVIAVAVWKLWMRRREAWKWVVASFAMGAIAFYVFQMLKSREQAAAIGVNDEAETVP